MNDYVIAQAGFGDTAACAQVKAECWREAYTGLIDDEILDRHFEAERLERTAAHFGNLISEGHYLWMALERDTRELVGIALASAARDADAPVPLELQMIYLRAKAHGSGVAQGLMQRCVGDADCYLWVLEGNARAIAFYEKEGFRLDDCTLTDRRGLVELRMVRRTDSS